MTIFLESACTHPPLQAHLSHDDTARHGHHEIHHLWHKHIFVGQGKFRREYGRIGKKLNVSIAKNVFFPNDRRYLTIPRHFLQQQGHAAPAGKAGGQ